MMKSLSFGNQSKILILLKSSTFAVPTNQKKQNEAQKDKPALKQASPSDFNSNTVFFFFFLSS